MDSRQIDGWIEELQKARPRMHTDGHGKAVDYGVDRRLIPFLRSVVETGNRTIETGSGLSTLAFLMFGARHTAVSPDAEEPARVRAWCTQRGIDLAGYEAVTAFSEDFLPGLGADALFDVVLVDGSHSFPLPAIDWFYLGRRLRKGGVMILDDLQLWPCAVVADFLDGDDQWDRMVRNERFGAWRSKSEPGESMGRWWGAQPYVVGKSRWPQVVSVIRKVTG